MKFAPKHNSGFTLIEVLITIAIFLILSSGIYFTYANILEVIGRTHNRTLATSLINKEIEYVRNLQFDDVGIVGGSPPGVIPASKVVSYEGQQFSINAFVRNIDDPFDGTIGGSPNDTAPADYRLVELQVTCDSCYNFVPVIMTTWAAPQNLESSTQNGSLFINVFDANGQPVSNAAITVANTSTVPSILINDTTNNSGTLQLVDVPTSTNAYSITISKPNYSSAQTYPLGGVSNPNPIQPHATVATQALTAISFDIDRLSQINVRSQNQFCAAVGSVQFTQTGNKLIGAGPNVLKYPPVTFNTGASGAVSRTGLEWDTYAFVGSDANFDVAGSSPLVPLAISPNTTTSLAFLVEPQTANSLLVTVINSSGTPLLDTSVNLTAAGFNNTQVTGEKFFVGTDWSGGQFTAQSGGINANVPPGQLTLMLNSSSTYTTSTNDWLVSNTIDFGTNTITYHQFSFNTVTQPPGATLQFQIATSNNPAGPFTFVGPNGTPATFYVAPAPINPIHNNQRYMQYQVFMNTTNSAVTPILTDVSIGFNSSCVPEGQAFWPGLTTGVYNLTATKTGYNVATSTVTVGAGWQETTVIMQ